MSAYPPKADITSRSKAETSSRPEATPLTIRGCGGKRSGNPNTHRCRGRCRKLRLFCFEGNGMNKSLTVVIAFSLALTCAASAKSAAPVHVPLPRNNPLQNAEQGKKQNSPPVSALFSEKKLPSVGRPMAIGYYPSGCLQGGCRTSDDRADVAGNAAVT